GGGRASGAGFGGGEGGAGGPPGFGSCSSFFLLVAGCGFAGAVIALFARGTPLGVAPPLATVAVESAFATIAVEAAAALVALAIAIGLAHHRGWLRLVLLDPDGQVA